MKRLREGGGFRLYFLFVLAVPGNHQKIHSTGPTRAEVSLTDQRTVPRRSYGCFSKFNSRRGASQRISGAETTSQHATREDFCRDAWLLGPCTQRVPGLREGFVQLKECKARLKFAESLELVQISACGCRE